MEISAKNLVERFYEEVAKDKYPNFTKTQIIACCFIPFKYMRKAISSRMTPEIRFKFLGEFIASPNKALSFITNVYPNIKHKDKPSPHWTAKTYSAACYIIERHICNMESEYKNEKDLIRSRLSEERYIKLLKLYSLYAKRDEPKEHNGISTGEL